MWLSQRLSNAKSSFSESLNSVVFPLGSTNHILLPTNISFTYLISLEKTIKL